MKKVFSLVLAFALIFSVSGLAAYADNSSIISFEVIEDNDEYYVVKTVYEESNFSLYSVNSTKTKSGYATIEMYNKSNELIATLTVYGTFTYNGKTSKATMASCDFDIFMSGWSCTAANSYCSGDTAYATATFEKFLARDIDATVTLTCSPSGVLS